MSFIPSLTPKSDDLKEEILIIFLLGSIFAGIGFTEYLFNSVPSILVIRAPSFAVEIKFMPL